MQADYDKQTAHGKDAEQQVLWDKKIKQLLASTAKLEYVDLKLR